MPDNESIDAEEDEGASVGLTKETLVSGATVGPDMSWGAGSVVKLLPGIADGALFTPMRLYNNKLSTATLQTHSRQIVVPVLDGALHSPSSDRPSAAPPIGAGTFEYVGCDGRGTAGEGAGATGTTGGGCDGGMLAIAGCCPSCGCPPPTLDDPSPAIISPSNLGTSSAHTLSMLRFASISSAMNSSTTNFICSAFSRLNRRPRLRARVRVQLPQNGPGSLPQLERWPRLSPLGELEPRQISRF